MKTKHSIPVSLGPLGVLWFGHDITINDFPDIREYVDSCLLPEKAVPKWVSVLTRDFTILKELVLAVKQTIPEESALKKKTEFPFIPPAPKRPKFISESGKFSDPIFAKTLLQKVKYDSYLIEHKEYLNRLQEWDITNKAHLASSGANSDGRKPPDLPGKPVPPKSVSKYGSMPEGKKCDFQHYLKAREKDMQLWEETVNEYKSKLHESQKQQEAGNQIGPKQAIADRLLRDIEIACAGSSLRFGKLSWKLLPGGKFDHVNITKHLQVMRAQYPQRTYDDSRINKVMGLNPSQAYLGCDEFDGYIVFLFKDCRHAVLECPWTGNALYLLEGDWIALSKMSKSELLNQHYKHARRIIHDDSGNWFLKLKNLIPKKSQAKS